MIVTLEGIDGSGKGTQAEALKAHWQPLVDARKRRYQGIREQQAAISATGKSVLPQPSQSGAWRDLEQVLAMGAGDADDLAAYHAATLREMGVACHVEIIWRERPGGGRIYSCQVRRRDDDTVEDVLALVKRDR